MARQKIARITAKKFTEPVDRITSLSNTFATQIHDVDLGMRTIIEQAKLEVNQKDETKKEICTFFDSIRSLSESTHSGLLSIRQMIEATTPLKKMSRDLRPVMRQLRKGLTVIVEAGEVSKEWVYLIDKSGIICD